MKPIIKLDHFEPNEYKSTYQGSLDDSLEHNTLMMTDRFGLELPAAALSDGTLRFIALSVLQQDPSVGGLICFEEPENGIHPQRIETILELLNDIAVDPTIPVGEENPLRQVIVNTHSTLVAGGVDEEDLLFARERTRRWDQKRIPEMTLSCLPATRRAGYGVESASMGEIIKYLTGAAPLEEDEAESAETTTPRRRRVVDRFHPDQLVLFPASREPQE